MKKCRTSLKNFGEFDRYNIESIIKAVEKGLVYLAKKGICHFDIAARNILICGSEEFMWRKLQISKVSRSNNFYKKNSCLSLGG